jgi:hypothetical protein
VRPICTGGMGIGEGGKLQDLAVMVVNLDAVWLLVLPVRLPQRGTHRVTRRGTLCSKKHQQQCSMPDRNAAQKRCRGAHAGRARLLLHVRGVVLPVVEPAVLRRALRLLQRRLLLRLPRRAYQKIDTPWDQDAP